ncbi:MAG TPA: FAD-dependent oxidoreductase [Candidatus Hydrogenedentes bacterium]|nr:FAD-dependent oxidoreductase [Candidatus Hydrogenedentota bacterium]
MGSFRWAAGATLAVLSWLTMLQAGAADFDVVVYGGTSGGVAASVQASRMGLRVILIEPSSHLGGLTSGGLGATDIGNKRAIGGIAREFYRRVKQYYDRPDAWNRQPREAYQNPRHSPGDDAMWTFEPHVAEQILRDMLREAHVEVATGERMRRPGGIVKKENRVEALLTESGRQFSGKMFIDATYEGDLMAAAGVSYRVGREAESEFGETLNGNRSSLAEHHQLMPGVDPWVIPGDPASGLLPGIENAGAGEEGAGDHRVQAYNLRLCFTDDPENRLPVTKPAGYSEQDYELLFRNFEAGETRVPWNLVLMPNRKTDINNNLGVSTDLIGGSWTWAEADYAERERIYLRHLAYIQGLIWTLANHPRVPETVRQTVSQWGPCRDEFIDNGGWPHQLYVREARRMVSDVVMTQHHCQGREVVPDPVGLAAYTMDSHHVRRYVDANGHVRNEGDVQVGDFPPYPISWRAIRPRREECANLLVPVCLSATHIAYGSIRMEPVFMVLGQSAATAAALAIQSGNAPDIQDIDYSTLKHQLLADGQILAWTP